ncbi:MAG: hypothetical protein QOH71_855 [Blastocatellia bacterium]|jgi:hypothetical protein|nr:hypothetical protein [Blastocatellia bacterium]
MQDYAKANPLKAWSHRVGFRATGNSGWATLREDSSKRGFDDNSIRGEEGAKHSTDPRSVGAKCL